MTLRSDDSSPSAANSKVIALTVATVLLLIPLSAQILLFRAGPEIIRPEPLPFGVPLLFGIPPLLAAGFPSVVFYFWCRPFFQGKLVSVRRTTVAFVLVSFLSALVYGFCWRDGLQYQGPFFTITAAVISFVCASVVLLMLTLSSRSTSLPLRLATNFVLFAWAFTYALPYLGELS